MDADLGARADGCAGGFREPAEGDLRRRKQVRARGRRPRTGTAGRTIRAHSRPRQRWQRQRRALIAVTVRPSGAGPPRHAPMKLDECQRAYWRRNLTLTLTLLSVWFGVTFIGGYYARELNSLSFMGFPLGFYLFAQGSLLNYLVIIVIYVFAMNRLDRQFRVDTRN